MKEEDTPKTVKFSPMLDIAIDSADVEDEKDIELELLPTVDVEDVDYEDRRNKFAQGGYKSSGKGTMLDIEFASTYQPYLKKEEEEDKIIVRAAVASEGICSRIGTALAAQVSKVRMALCPSTEIEDELDEPPMRYIYLGKQQPDPENDFEDHALNENGERIQRPPRKAGETETIFPTNYLSTMKYQPFFMFPFQNLAEQLSRTANFYFLCILIISLPFIQFGPKPYTMVLLPLALVLGLNAAKEIVEDYNRWKLDTLDNNTIVDIWDGRQFIEKPWKDVRVGDLIRIKQDSNRIPADIFILQSSSAKGLCNIETSNLDGETNLKQKQAVGETYLLTYSDETGSDYPINLTLEVESEAPNELMGSKSWKGNVRVNDGPKCALGMNQLILRGCSLKNTDWIIAIVVFTGMETKLMLNNKEGELKRSHLDNDVDRFIKYVFMMMLTFSLFGVAWFAIWNQKYPEDHWYLYLDSDGDSKPASGSEQFYRFFMWIGNYEILIPMTLLVTVELCKLTQTSFINYDKDMRYLDEEELDMLKRGRVSDSKDVGIWAVCRTSSLNDELGQIGWVFSDKTGTLTRNVMEFQNCYTCAETISVFAICSLASAVKDKEELIASREIQDAISNLLELGKVGEAIGIHFQSDTKFRIFIPCLRGKDFEQRRNEAKVIKEKLHEYTEGDITLKSGNSVKTLEPHLKRLNGKTYGPGRALKDSECFARMQTDETMPRYSEKECHFGDNRLTWEATIDDHADNFLTCLSVCHNVIPDYPEEKEETIMDEDGKKSTVKRTVTSYSQQRNCVTLPPKYQASSPDEKAFVVFCKNLQYYFHDVDVERIDVGDVGIDGTRAVVRVRGEDVIFDILDVIEFSSARKRMSVICRDPRTQTIKVFCKGADNIILERLTDVSKALHWAKCERALKEFATQGLRTLCLAIRELSEEEYIAWHKRCEEAKSNLENKEELLSVCYAEMEQELTLLGATAIEDRLQDGVPETIMNLHAAGLNVWVLTGDKVETAINIGRSCRLITDKMHNKKGSTTLIVIDIDEMLEADQARAQTTKALDQALKDVEDNTPAEKHDQGLVLSGKALGFVFPIRKRDKFGKEIPPTKKEKEEEEKLQQQLLKICVNCSAVLCCRVSPKQKAQMVDLVKKNVEGSITLSIGDGANDVPMIKSAHVGVGIRGHEGIQAVMASDYAIGQFKYLNTLLFIHGAWNFRRSGTVIMYIFYKSAILILGQLWFGFYSAFSATNYIEPLSAMMFNTIYTQFPITVLGMFDRPYPKDIALLCPRLYSERGCYSFTDLQFFSTILEGAIQSIIIFYITGLAMDSSPNSDGHTYYMWNTSFTGYTAILFVVTFKVAILFRTWIKWTIYTLVLGPVCHFLISIWWTSHYIERAPPLSPTPNWQYVGAFWDLIGDSRFYFVTIICVGVTFVPVMLIDYYKRVMFGCREHCIQELMRDDPEQFNEFKRALKKNQEDFFKKEVQVKEDQKGNGYQDFDQEGELVSQKDARIARLVTRKTQAFVNEDKKRGLTDASSAGLEGRYLGSAFNLGLENFSSDFPSNKRVQFGRESFPNKKLSSSVYSVPRRTSMLENRLRLPTNDSTPRGNRMSFRSQFKAIGTMSFLTDLGSDSEDEEEDTSNALSPGMVQFEEAPGRFKRVNEAKSAPLPRHPGTL